MVMQTASLSDFLIPAHRSGMRENSEPQEVFSVLALLHEMAASVVPHSLSSEELLTQVYQILT